MKTFRRYLTSDPNLMSLSTLDLQLSKFFMKVKKLDGGEYEPDSLTTLHRGIQRYFDDQGKKFNILTDPEFEKSRDVLAAKRKELKKLGMGNKPNATRELEKEEVDKMFNDGFFGDQDPVSLQRTMWWILSLHFGWRARNESRKLKWGDISVEYDMVRDLNYLEWHKERGTKTRVGNENEEERKYSKAYETKTDRCPVYIYQTFMQHRPIEALAPGSPFYLAIRHKRKSNDKIWYLNSPLGKNKIGEFLKGAKSDCDLTGVGKVANHSVRKTSIGRLLDADVPEIFVCQHTGIKNRDTLMSYKRANKDQMHKISNILNSGAPQPSGSNVPVPFQPFQPIRPTPNGNNNNWSNFPCMSTQQQPNNLNPFGGAYFAGACTFNMYYGEPDAKKQKTNEQ